MGGPKASEISELRRMAKWREPPEEIKGEDELLTGEELKLFQSVAVQFHILAMDSVDCCPQWKNQCEKWPHHAHQISLPSKE